MDASQLICMLKLQQQEQNNNNNDNKLKIFSYLLQQDYTSFV